MHVDPEQRHRQAVMAPRGPQEQALIHLLHGLQGYAKTLSDEPGGLDADSRRALAEAVVQGCQAARTLLDGPLGRLDGRLLAREFDEVLALCGHHGAGSAAAVVPIKDGDSSGKRRVSIVAA